MPYRHFQVPCSGGEVETVMTTFLSQHRVLKVEKQFVTAGLATHPELAPKKAE